MMRLKFSPWFVEIQDPYAVGYTKFRVPLNISADLSLAVEKFHDAICQVADSDSYHYRFNNQGELVRFPTPGDVALIDQGPEWTFQQVRTQLLELQLFPDPPQYSLDHLPPLKLQIEPIREQIRLSLREQLKNWLRSIFYSPGIETESLETGSIDQKGLPRAGTESRKTDLEPAQKYINSLREAGQRRQHEIGWNFEQLSNWYLNQWSAGEAGPAIRTWFAKNMPPSR